MGCNGAGEPCVLAMWNRSRPPAEPCRSGYSESASTLSHPTHLLLFVALTACVVGCMHDAQTSPPDFASFEKDRYFYTGDAYLPWLESDVEVIVDTTDEPIPPRHIDILKFAFQLPPATRDQLERFLYERYRDEVYGSMVGGDDVTPSIASADEIWNLLSAPGVSTPPDHRIASDCFFAITFECVWDPEHGLSILYDERGRIVSMGGQGSHF